MKERIDEIRNEHLEVIETLGGVTETVVAVAEKMVSCLKAGGKICFMGNGGSAADSQHLAAEFVGRYQKERRAYPAIAFTTDASILTAVGNDYGFDRVFERQVEALVEARDVVVGISTSGNSPSVVKAMEKARAIGATTVGMTGAGGGELAEWCDFCLAVESGTTARVQEGHILLGHTLCELVEEALS